jgi:myo-inositol-1(or 4)-monophosphatase
MFASPCAGQRHWPDVMPVESSHAAGRRRLLAVAVRAARAAGVLMRAHLRSAKKINEATRHDLKLELDVRCQKRIEGILRRARPGLPVLGEEGVLGDPDAPERWVVDPIDGTVNFAYGIPHACVAIALQRRDPKAGRPGAPATFTTMLGVVYDPFCDELWTATRTGPALLNGRRIRASRRARLGEAIISMGFAKNRQTLAKGVPTFNALIRRVRKIRMMGAAALGLVYVASGRLDAYIEYGLRLWDVAAGGLILERAGGDFWHKPLPGEHACSILANNGLLRAAIARVAPPVREELRRPVPKNS